MLCCVVADREDVGDGRGAVWPVRVGHLRPTRAAT